VEGFCFVFCVLVVEKRSMESVAMGLCRVGVNKIFIIVAPAKAILGITSSLVWKVMMRKSNYITFIRKYTNNCPRYKLVHLEAGCVIRVVDIYSRSRH